MERARTVVFTVREAHGEVSGSVWEPFFSRSRREGISGGFCRGYRTDFLRFSKILGVPWETLFDENLVFFAFPKNVVCSIKGRRQRRGQRRGGRLRSPNFARHFINNLARPATSEEVRRITERTL